MKILYFIGYPIKMAGSQKQISELILGLPKDIKKEVVVNKKGGVSSFFEDHNIKVHILETASPLDQYGKKLLKLNFFTGLKAIFSWLRFTASFTFFLLRNKIDFVHFNDLRALSLGFLSCFLSRRKIICHIQGETNFTKKYITIAYRIISFFVDQYILNGDFDFSSVCKNQHKIAVVHTGILDPSITSHKENIIKNDKVKIGYFASVVPFKGQHLFYKAFSKLAVNIQKQAEIYFVGNIDENYKWYHEYCCNEIEELGLRNIVFIGWTDNPFGYMKNMDVVALTSYRIAKLEIDGVTRCFDGNEGFPTVHIESMAFSKPLIGTNIAAVSDLIVNGRNGFLVEEDNIVELSNALTLLITDPLLRINLGKAGREMFVSRFSRQIFVDKVVDIYRRLIRL